MKQLFTTNSAELAPWKSALNRAIAQDNSKKVMKAEQQLLDQAAGGESWAIKELGDRLDGKAAQLIVGSGGGPVMVGWKIET